MIEPTGIIFMPTFFAQVDLSTLGGQASMLSDWLSSPAGALSIVLAGIALALVLPRPRGFDIACAALLFVMSFPLHYGTLIREQNTLIPPLQVLRSVSRPLAYGLLALVALRALAIGRGDRVRVVSGTAALFLAFQIYYVVQIALFDNLVKGALAIFSVSAMFFVFCCGLGREMQDASTTRRALEPLGWLSLLFVAANLIQLTLGFRSSFGGGRFLGTSGNAQAMGSMCCLCILTCTYLAGDSAEHRRSRWLYIGVAVLLTAFLFASGSRGNTIALLVGLVAMFRTQLGKLLGVGVAAIFGLVIYSAFASDDAVGAQRLLDTTDTRMAVWTNAFMDFQSSPIFGMMPRFGSELPSSGVESSILRALALMGMLGGLLLVITAASAMLDALASVRLGKVRPEFRKICDFHVGLTCALLTCNVFEGLAFGVLTFHVMLTYACLALGSFMRAQLVEAQPGAAVSDGAVVTTGLMEGPELRAHPHA